MEYFYDADGELVRRVSAGVTTVYVGEHAEWRNNIGWGNYYFFNGQRVAMRNQWGVFWHHGDHLGSASLSTNASGGTHSQTRYGPFGHERWVWGAMPTAYKFTDQRAEDAVGLYDYGARLYSPLLARFISPDSIVPVLIPLLFIAAKVALKAAPAVVAGTGVKQNLSGRLADARSASANTSNRFTQRTAFCISAMMFASSAAVNAFKANAVGHTLPSSRCAESLKPSVA